MVAKKNRILGRLYRDADGGWLSIYLRNRNQFSDYDEFYVLGTHSVMNMGWHSLVTFKASSVRDLVHIPTKDEHKIIRRVWKQHSSRES